MDGERPSGGLDGERHCKRQYELISAVGIYRFRFLLYEGKSSAFKFGYNDLVVDWEV